MISIFRSCYKKFVLSLSSSKFLHLFWFLSHLHHSILICNMLFVADHSVQRLYGVNIRMRLYKIDISSDYGVSSGYLSWCRLLTFHSHFHKSTLTLSMLLIPNYPVQRMNRVDISMRVHKINISSNYLFTSQRCRLITTLRSTSHF